MENNELLERIKQAELVLVGLGEEFDGTNVLKGLPEYEVGLDYLKRTGRECLTPAWIEFCSQKRGGSRVGSVLKKLSGLLQEKNYFFVSVSTNSEIGRTAWKKNRLVMPCGSALQKQCAKGCEDMLQEVTREDWARLWQGFEGLYANGIAEEGNFGIGNCPKCGAALVLNNIYAEKYNENGYLEQWNLYLRWLQGTVNRRLLILELGVGMKYPSVIRWPFEKAAFFNQKAYFYRINEKLYQLTEELSGKGCGISQNSIDWMSQL